MDLLLEHTTHYRFMDMFWVLSLIWDIDVAEKLKEDTELRVDGLFVSYSKMFEKSSFQKSWNGEIFNITFISNFVSLNINMDSNL